MKTEEAIRILDPDTSAAALCGLGHDEAVALVEDACRLAVAALKAPKVTHAHWIEHDDGYQTCSNCGEEHCWADYRASYCDVCGAKMDEEIGAAEEKA